MKPATIFDFGPLRSAGMFDVVFYQPEIPPNTGNAIRMCANTGCRLHLIEPLGFSLDDARLRRAGLDYHELTVLRVHASWQACLAALEAERPARRLHLFTTRARHHFGAVRFEQGDVLVFGRETAGLPAAVLDAAGPEHWVRIPMMVGNRSLNLSNAAAVAVFEGWRQLGYAGAETGAGGETVAGGETGAGA